jgi:hypothetical protein
MRSRIALVQLLKGLSYSSRLAHLVGLRVDVRRAPRLIVGVRLRLRGAGLAVGGEITPNLPCTALYLVYTIRYSLSLHTLYPVYLIRYSLNLHTL